MVDTRRKRATGDERAPDEPARPRPRTGSRTVFSLSEDETFEFGRALARALRGSELILLEGDLGLGKTVFARGIAAGLGVPPEDVSSPSFTLVQEYPGGRLPVVHVDLYRLDDAEDLAGVGIEEYLSLRGVVIVEWGEKLPPYLRRDALTVRFHDVGEGSRRIEILESLERTAPPPRGDA